MFTSGGTEANNLALKGAAWAGKARGHRIVTSAVEHHAVGHTLRYLEKFGFEIVELPVDRYGRVDPDQLEAALNDKTILVSIMLANNEVGHDPARSPRSRARRPRAQGRPVPRRRGPGGAVRRPRRRGARRRPGLARGAQVRGPEGRRRAVRPPRHAHPRPAAGRRRRSGIGGPAPRTWPGPSGLAAAYELSCAERAGDRRAARARSASGSPTAVLAVPGVELTGHPKERLPGLLSLIARDTDGASVAMSLDLEGIAASVGSACTTGSTEVSHVLTAMGYPEEEARGALRLSLGRTTTDEEIAMACDVVPRVIASMRLGSAAVAADPLGQGVRREPDPRRDVGRGRLVGRRGAPPRAGPRRRRRLDAPARRRRHVLRVQEELLLARCRRRRPARRRPARHPVLRHEPRARVRRRRAPAVPRRVPRRRRRRARASTATRT